MFAKEREAAINQLMQEIAAQERSMLELTSALRGALEAGTATSDSMQTTIGALENLMGQFQSPESAHASAAPTKPFDIADYTAAAREFAGTARELERLAQRLDEESPGLARVAAGASAELTRVGDHTFWRLIQLGLALVGAGLIAALVYRVVASRFARR